MVARRPQLAQRRARLLASQLRPGRSALAVFCPWRSYIWRLVLPWQLYLMHILTLFLCLNTHLENRKITQQKYRYNLSILTKKNSRVIQAAYGG